MTDILTAKGVVECAVKARTEGRLGYQNPEVLKANGYGCLYRYPETNVVCGVGAGISDEQFEKMKEAYHHYNTIGGIAWVKLFTIEPGDLEILSEMQRRHDAVVRAIECGADPSEDIAAFDRYLDAQLAALNNPE